MIWFSSEFPKQSWSNLSSWTSDLVLFPIYKRQKLKWKGFTVLGYLGFHGAVNTHTHTLLFPSYGNILSGSNKNWVLASGWWGTLAQLFPYSLLSYNSSRCTKQGGIQRKKQQHKQVTKNIFKGWAIYLCWFRDGATDTDFWKLLSLYTSTA